MSAILTLAVIVFIVGVGRKIYQYASTPAPLKIPTTPAPTTRGGVVLRMAREVVFFDSLFKASKPTWIFSWLFHAGLLIALLCHLR
ncbi:MAG: nitrate reductase, partial [Pseudomonadota bacterium]